MNHIPLFRPVPPTPQVPHRTAHPKEAAKESRSRRNWRRRGLWWACITLAFGGVAAGIPMRVAAIRDLMTPQPSDTKALIPRSAAAKLWDRLAADGWIRLKADGTLWVTPRKYDLILIDEAERNGTPSPLGDPAFTRLREAMRVLYDQDVGRVILQQVALWNLRMGGYTAVRDDVYPAVRDETPIVRLGQRPNHWRALDSQGHDVADSNTPVPERFHKMVAQGGRRPFGDWGSWVGNLGPNGRLLRTFELATPATAVIQTIGHVDLRESSLPAAFTVARRCNSPCSTQADDIGSEITLHLPAGRTTVALTVAPLRGVPVPVSDLLLDKTGDDKVPRWTDRPVIARPAPASARPSTVISHDGTTLWEPGQGFTPTTTAASMLPVLGYGPDDPFGALPDLMTGEPVTLTIDMNAQRAAELAVKRMEAVLSSTTPRNRHSGLQSVTIMAMRVDTGAVISHYSSPAPAPGIHEWDYRAQRAGDPKADPLMPRGLRIFDLDSTPGSVFKIVTAYAAILAAPVLPAVQAMIRGCNADAKGWFACFGLPRSATGYLLPGRQKPIQNFESKPIGNSVGKPLAAPQCDPDAGVSHGIGMVEMMRDSVNAVAIAMGMTLDQPVATRYDALTLKRHVPDRAGLTEEEYRRRLAEQLPDLTGHSWLLDAADQLGLLEPIDLAGPARPLLRPRTSIQNTSLWVPAAEHEFNDLRSPETKQKRPSGAVDALAQAAMGQRVRMTVLHGLRMIAGIVSGSVPTPYIVEAMGPNRFAPPPRRPLSGDLEPERQGLKAVPQVGTAAGAWGRSRSPQVRAASCHVWLKTGTAQTHLTEPKQSKTDRVNSAWAVAVIDPIALDILAGGLTPVIRDRVAIGCQITRTAGPLRTGAVCAQLIAMTAQGMAFPDGELGSTDALVDMLLEEGFEE